MRHVDAYYTMARIPRKYAQITHQPLTDLALGPSKIPVWYPTSSSVVFGIEYPKHFSVKQVREQRSEGVNIDDFDGYNGISDMENLPAGIPEKESHMFMRLIIAHLMLERDKWAIATDEEKRRVDPDLDYIPSLQDAIYMHTGEPTLLFIPLRSSNTHTPQRVV